MYALHSSFISTSDGLHDLVTFVQFKKHEKHPWRSATINVF